MNKPKEDSSAEGVHWDLGVLYKGREDPRLLVDMKEAREMAEKFADAYRGRQNFDAGELLAALQEYEQIHEVGMRPFFFAILLFSEQTQDHNRRELLEEIQEKWNAIECLLAFFRLAVTALPEALIHGMTREMTRGKKRHRGLGNYRHFIFHQRRWQPYTLQESEEIAAAGKDLRERSVLVTRFDTIIGSLSVPGEDHPLKMDEVLAMLHRPAPAPRASAFDGLLRAIAERGGLFTDILNALVGNHYQDSRQRGHPFPMHKSLLANGVEGDMIETMMRRVEKHYPMARRYFRLKGRLLGMTRLRYTDQFVPPEREKAEVFFPRARSVVLASMKAFHPRFYSAARELFDKGRIDADVKAGKRDGAFCKSFAPSHPPFICMNYTGHLRDLMVLAHEIGHGIQFTFSRGLTYLNYAPAPILSETAAILCEMIVADHMLGETTFQPLRKNLLACHIESILTTVFRQTVLTRFEQSIYNQDRPLSDEEICQCWWDANLRLYGEDLALPALYRWGWACVPHFFHRHFYCYNYIFGNLCAILLFQKCRSRPAFRDDVAGLFSRGGSEGPLAMLGELGFDFRNVSVWDTSLAYLESLIGSLKNLEDKNPEQVPYETKR